MIILKDIAKIYPTRRGPRTVFSNINLEIQKQDRIGILGANGAGKSTLIRIIGGAEPPSRGKVERLMSTSWPLASGGAFQGSLTAIDNVKFICRIYAAPIAPAIEFVKNFTELGNYLDEPVKTYSSGMKSKLGFALSMIIDFDCYLIDESTAVGDKRFREKCRVELFEKRGERALLMVSHQMSTIKQYCNKAGVLKNGSLFMFPDVESAYEFYTGDKLLPNLNDEQL